MKKLVSLLMAVVFVFTMAVPAFAAASANDVAQPAAISSNDATGTDDIFSDVVDFFKGIFQNIIDFFKWLFGINSNVSKYDITYYLDESKTQIHSVQSYEVGATIGSVSVPTKPGYTFIGWNPELPGAMPAQNLEVYAVWSVKTYVLSFNSNGGTPIASKAVPYGEKIVRPADPTKAGYVFLGWEGYTEGMTMPANAITFNAIWDAKKTTIKFNSNGGSYIAPITAEVGVKVEKPADPVRMGYKFIGWDGIIPTTQPDEDMTFTASWEKVPYTATWKAEGVSAINQTYYYGDVITPPSVSKDGYIPGEWIAADGSTYKPGATMPANDVTYTMTWAAATDTPYTVETYVMDTNGAYGAPAKVTKQGETGVEVTADYTVGEGFALNEEKSILSGAIAADGSTVLKVYIDRNNYTLTTVINNVKTENKYYFDAPVTAPAIPAKEGYTGAWTPAVPATMPANDVTSTAVYTPNKYKVTYLASENAEKAFAEYDVDFGAEITVPADKPTLSGKHFTGWTPAVPATMPAKDLTFVATWQDKIDCTIIFDANGGAFADKTTYKAVTVKFGDVIVPPSENPVKVGNVRFAGWSTDPKATAPEALGELLSTGTTTYYAVYVEAVCKVSYWVDGVMLTAEDYDGDYAPFDVTESDPSEIVVEKLLTKKGYTFTGWNYDGETYAALDVIEVDLIKDEEIKLEGTFTPNKYNVIFNANGGSWVKGEETLTEKKQENLAYNAAIVLPVNPTPAKDMAFVGWATEADATAGEKFTTLEALEHADDLTLYAVYVDDSFTVTYKITMPDGSIGYKDSVTLNMGDEIIVPAEEAIKDDEGDVILDGYKKDGYTVSAWDKEIPDEIAVDNYTEDHTYTAEYIANEYNIYFLNNVSYLPLTVEYAETIPHIDAPTLKGYSFGGWTWMRKINNEYKAIDLQTTMPAYDIYLSAIWNIKTYTVTFDANGGTISTDDNETVYLSTLDKTVEYGEKFTSPAYDDVTRTGYTLNDENTWVWYNADTGDELAEAPATMPDYNLKAVAQWTVNEHKLTIDTQGGTLENGSAVTKEQTLAYNTAITLPALKKTGYTLGVRYDDDKVVKWVWTKTADGTKIEDLGSMPDYDVTVTAQWTINTYKITFDANGGSWADGATLTTKTPVNYGDFITAPKEDPVREHYTFEGWSYALVDAKGNLIENLATVPDTMPDGYLRATAKWKPVAYSVYFYGSDADMRSDKGGVTLPNEYGEIIDNRAVDEGKFSKTGNYLTYKYFSKTTDADGAVSFTENGVETLVFEDDGITLKETSYVTMPGYDVYAVAIYTAKTYTVTWDDGIDTTENTKVNVKYGDVIPKPAELTRTGYTFVKWNGYEDEMTMPANDVTFTAVWKANLYDATFKANGGVWADGADERIVKDIAFDSAITAPEDPTRIGHTFGKLDENKNLVKWTPAVGTMDEEGKEFIAQWTPIKYKVEFEADGAIIAAETKYLDYGSVIEIPATEPTKTGYTFEGWSKDGGNTVITGVDSEPADGTPDLGTVPVDGITFKAVFTANSAIGYIVEYYEMDTEGNYPETATGKSHEAGTADESAKYEIAAKEGFTVDEEMITGYTYDSETGEISVTVAADSSTVVKVYFSRNQYKLTRKVIADGIFVENDYELYYYGATVADLVAPTAKPGFVFDTSWDWDLANNESYGSKPDFMPAQDVVVVATLTKCTYTIAFMAKEYNGWSAFSITKPFGTDITEPDKTFAGYTFSHWEIMNDDDEYVRYEFPATMPAMKNNNDTLLVFAVFTKN